MVRFCFLASALFWTLGGTALFAEAPQETPVTSRVVSVSLFKNGVFAVQEEIIVPGNGRYVLHEVPTPLHGTFFVESDAQVVTTADSRKVEKALDELETLDVKQDFAGKKVCVTLRDGKTFDAVIVGSKAKKTGDSSHMVSVGISGEAWTLRKETGEVVFLPNANEIARLELLATENSQVLRDEPVLLFDVTTKEAQSCKILLSYLTKGMTWAPSYRIELDKEGALTLEQTAVLFNEWRNLVDVPCCLISGFPKMDFREIVSPLSPNSTLQAFFQSLSVRPEGDSNPRMLTQQSVMLNSVRNPMESPAEAPRVEGSFAGDVPDVFYQNIGSQSILQGQRVQRTIEKKKTEWRKKVVWFLEDERDEYGRLRSRDEYLGNHYARTTSGSASKLQEYTEPYDVLLFQNPFAFPITTGTAAVYDGRNFVSQTVLGWANPGEEVSLGINKALSIRGESKEEEITSEMFQDTNQRIYRNGSDYRIATVRATIVLRNQRAEAVPCLLCRQFSGEILENTEGGTVRQLGDLRGVNRRCEWRLECTLGAGETKEITFTYKVLVRL